MVTWNNLDTLESFKELSKVGRWEAISGQRWMESCIQLLRFLL